MLQLFHRIADPACARVRRHLVEHGLLRQVQLRNVEYPEALADLTRHGGTSVPALWDGETLHEGLEVVLARLARVG